MIAPCFVDTNVLVYARDASEPEKQARARAWMEHLWASRTGRLSWQVLSEFYVTVTRKLPHPLAPVLARAEVMDLAAWHPVAPDRQMVAVAWGLQDRYQLAWWDALVVAAAQVTGCSRLLTEDLQAGQDLDGVTVVDPFAAGPEPVEP